MRRLSSNSRDRLGGRGNAHTETRTETIVKKTDAGLGVGAVLAMVLCCAGPALVAAGAVGAVGAFLSNPVVLALAFALLVGAVIAGTTRSRGREDACCAPKLAAPDDDQASENAADGAPGARTKAERLP
jgi:hypothetical protein